MILPVVSSRKKKLITLTPLIDVVFILLLFFMLSSSFIQWRSVEFDTSSGRGSQSSPQRSLLLRLHGDGRMDLAGSPLEHNQLARQLAQSVRRDPDVSVSVEARDGVALQALIDAFDQLEQSGIKRYGMVTR